MPRPLATCIPYRLPAVLPFSSRFCVCVLFPLPSFLSLCCSRCVIWFFPPTFDVLFLLFPFSFLANFLLSVYLTLPWRTLDKNYISLPRILVFLPNARLIVLSVAIGFALCTSNPPLFPLPIIFLHYLFFLSQLFRLCEKVSSVSRCNIFFLFSLFVSYFPLFISPFSLVWGRLVFLSSFVIGFFPYLFPVAVPPVHLVFFLSGKILDGGKFLFVLQVSFCRSLCPCRRIAHPSPSFFRNGDVLGKGSSFPTLAYSVRLLSCLYSRPHPSSFVLEVLGEGWIRRLPFPSFLPLSCGSLCI